MAIRFRSTVASIEYSTVLLNRDEKSHPSAWLPSPPKEAPSLPLHSTDAFSQSALTARPPTMAKGATYSPRILPEKALKDVFLDVGAVRLGLIQWQVV